MLLPVLLGKYQMLDKSLMMTAMAKRSRNQWLPRREMTNLEGHLDQHQSNGPSPVRVIDRRPKLKKDQCLPQRHGNGPDQCQKLEEESRHDQEVVNGHCPDQEVGADQDLDESRYLVVVGTVPALVAGQPLAVVAGRRDVAQTRVVVDDVLHPGRNRVQDEVGCEVYHDAGDRVLVRPSVGVDVTHVPGRTVGTVAIGVKLRETDQRSGMKKKELDVLIGRLIAAIRQT